MPKHGTSKEHNTHTHTHTHTHISYDRLNVECNKQLQQFVVVARSSTWSAAQDCSPTVTTTDTNSKKQSPTVSVYPLRYAIWRVEMLLKTWNFRFRHVYCVHCAILYTLYNGYSAILSTVNGYSAILCTVNGYSAILCTVNGCCAIMCTVNGCCAILPTYKWYCAILSTEHWMFLTMHSRKQLHLTDTTHCAHLQY